MAYYLPPPLEVIDDSNLLDAFEEAATTNRKDYNSKERNKLFFEETVPRLSDVEFRMHFRLSRTSFQSLMEILGSTMSLINNCEKKMLLFLRILGTQETLESISMSFDVSISTAWNSIRDILKVLKESGFLNEMIQLPSNLSALASQFQSRSNMKFPPIFIGAIDCKEVEIQMPHISPESYYNRKSRYSIKLQATVDALGNYWDVFIGWPGKTNDSRVFRNSPLHQKLANAEFGAGYMLIGDSAYPNTQFLCTPFKNNRTLTLNETIFNKHLSKLRQIVECVFGRTTERWRRMKFIYMRDMHDICDIIHVCCAMHNFCIDQADSDFDITDESVPSGESDDEEDDESDQPINISSVSQQYRCRNDVLQYFISH